MEAHEAILLLDKEEDESKNTNQVAETCRDLGIQSYGARTKRASTSQRRCSIRLLVATVRLLPGWLLSIAALLSILLTDIRSTLLWRSIASTVRVLLIGVLSL